MSWVEVRDVFSWCSGHRIFNADFSYDTRSDMYLGRTTQRLELVSHSCQSTSWQGVDALYTQDAAPSKAIQNSTESRQCDHTTSRPHTTHHSSFTRETGAMYLSPPPNT
jgi:hypothetical protein